MDLLWPLHGKILHISTHHPAIWLQVVLMMFDLVVWIIIHAIIYKVERISDPDFKRLSFLTTEATIISVCFNSCKVQAIINYIELF